MKISEKLAELKQKEGELMRLYDLRDSVAKQSFSESGKTYKEDTKEEIEKNKAEFQKKKIERLNEITKQIQKAKESIIEGKNIVNKKNVELGIDKKLVKMKFLRVELSRLMKLMKSRGFSVEGIDLDVWDEMGLSTRIKELERAKSRLDAEIQSANWATIL